MNRRHLALVVVLSVVACQAGTPGSPTLARPSPDPTASATQTVSPTVTPAASPVALPSGPAMTVTVVGDRPVIAGGDGPPGHNAVMPTATAVDADGAIVAFLVWFGATRGDQVVTAARSADGRAWSVDPAPIYSDLGMTTSPPGPVPGAALRETDGTWLLFGWAAAPAARTSFSTWRATAPAVDGPWAIPPGQERVLAPGPAGAWDDQTAAVSAVLPVGSGYAMWYEGQRPGTTTRGGIGYASSGDGVTWGRHGDPVVGPGTCGPATEAAALAPQVWRRDDGYLMLFGGSSDPAGKVNVLGATSDDGIHWSCTGRVLLGTTDLPGSRGIETIQGATLDGEPVMLIESLIDGGSEIWLASVAVGP